jgi:hypothetical protein
MATDRDYMRAYMRHYRRFGKGKREDKALRPIILPPAQYADLAAAVFGDPPIGRRAIDAGPGRQPYQLQPQLEALAARPPIPTTGSGVRPPPMPRKI